MDKKKYILGFVVFCLAFAGIVFSLIFLKNKELPLNNQYIELAKCLDNSGIKFYGAFWCPACAAQKANFGSRTAVKLLPYKECSTKQREQNEECNEVNITSYPTWIYEKDDLRCSGIIEPKLLSVIAGCNFHKTEISTEEIFNNFIDSRLSGNEVLKDNREEYDKVVKQFYDHFDVLARGTFNKDSVLLLSPEEIYKLIVSSSCNSNSKTIEDYKKLKTEEELNETDKSSDG